MLKDLLPQLIRLLLFMLAGAMLTLAAAYLFD